MKYTDSKGRIWLFIAETNGGTYGWFRPIEHADDGYYDRNFKISAMRLVEDVTCK